VRVPRWLDLRAVVSYLLPALAGAGLLVTLPAGVGPPLAALAAVLLALVLAGRAAARVEKLRQWVARIGRGERARAPLPSGAPDVLDALSAELSSYDDALRGETTRLINERDRLEAMLGAMVEGVLVIDRQGQVVRANERVRQIFGLGRDDPLLGRRLWDVSRDTELSGVVREAMNRSQPTFREVQLRGEKDRFLAVTAGPTADRTAWVIVLHDVTEMKRLERVRTDFVANVSHELRTPMTAIKGFAETLASTGYDDHERVARYVSIIERQASRLSRLIEDLLTLSDLELGKMAVRMRTMALAPIVHDVVELLSGTAERAHVKVRIEVDESVEAKGDPDRLAQVVSNLLENAIKFSENRGEVTVRVQRAATGGLVELQVVDRGVGIPAEDLPRLAERFYRVDKARSSELGGTGLGLSIVKHIVQAHGGSLLIESRVGVGTTVTVRLPAADSP
jgi:two-component system, OmpR family, phosphate regulon sensor histidine kinase PhoR